MVWACAAYPSPQSLQVKVEKIVNCRKLDCDTSQDRYAETSDPSDGPKDFPFYGHHDLPTGYTM